MRRKVPEYVKQISKELRKNQTTAEEKLWNVIRNKKLSGHRFVRQYAIGRYIADFYCSKSRVVIKVDGEVHENDYQKEYDAIRDEEIASRGIRIIRFKNQEIFDNIDDVLNTLIEFL